MITCFTPAGFTRFALSLSRFCDMNRTEALLFVNQCARANYDTFRTAAPDERTGKTEGLTLSLFDTANPYQTEVQLYQSMQALLENIRNETESQRETAAHLRALCNNLNEHCWNSYGLDIEDERTVYALCERTLEPATEPACVLLSDWNRLIDVKCRL